MTAAGRGVGDATERARRPNILVILTDEERERAWWPASVRLRARERLARRGLRFTNHHVHSMPCSPSRSTIVTGRHAHASGVLDNVDFPWQPSMDPAIPTFGTLLCKAGYRTAWHGKWHLSEEQEMTDSEGSPSLAHYGFEDWTGPDAHGAPYLGHRKDGTYAAQAAHWIANHGHDRDPWCCVVSFVNPHDIMLYPRFRKARVRDWGVQLPGNFDDDLATKPRVQHRWRAVCDAVAGRVRSDEQWRMIANAYIDLHLEVDRHIGTVLDALAASGAENDTIVIFTSDHGDLAGAHGQRQKGAFVYREVVNVPLTIAGPGISARGATCDALTAAVDLVPTLCALAGTVAPQDLPGRDLSPLLRAVDPLAAGLQVRDEVLFLHDAYSSIGPQGPTLGFGRGSFDGRWKYARWFLPRAQDTALEACDLELYDTVEDPWEQHNLASGARGSRLVGDHEDRLRSLLRREIGDDVMRPPEPGPSKLAWLRLLMRDDGAPERAVESA